MIDASKLARVKAVFAAVERRESASARNLASELLAEAESSGSPSPYLYWLMGYVHERSGDVLRAFRAFGRALAADPWDIQIRERVEVCAHQLQDLVISWKADARGTPPDEIYQELVRAGEAPPAVHLAAARHSFESGDLATSERIARGITALYPYDADAWILLKEIGQVRNDGQATSEASRTLSLLRIPRATRQ